MLRGNVIEEIAKSILSIISDGCHYSRSLLATIFKVKPQYIDRAYNIYLHDVVEIKKFGKYTFLKLRNVPCVVSSKLSLEYAMNTVDINKAMIELSRSGCVVLKPKTLDRPTANVVCRHVASILSSYGFRVKLDVKCKICLDEEKTTSPP